jgi:putative component of toxin-antitoxin plasmid stabilization module
LTVGNTYVTQLEARNPLLREVLVILLTGGTKTRQQRDIEAAKEYWRDYKQAKRLIR